MKKKAIVAGHLCVDITPAFPENNGKKKTSEILKPGKLVDVGDATISTGGAVANTGLAMKVLGADVALMGKVGKDAFGDIIYNIAKGYDAAEGMIIDESVSTSYTIAIAIPGNDRIFLHNPGANHTFKMDDIKMDVVNESALFHFGYPPLMRSMYENEGAELIKIMKTVKESGVATSLDMAAVDEASDAGKVDWGKLVAEVLPYVDFFVPSVEELCYMIDKERFNEWQERAGDGDITEVLDIEKDVRPLAEKCMELGAKVLLIKCGAPGLYYRTASTDVLKKVSDRVELNVEEWADKEGFEKSYVPEKVRSGTGAGDTCIAAFLTAMLEGYSVEDCMHLAAGTGASCVEAYDALSGLRSFDELKEKIQAGWKKHGE